MSGLNSISSLASNTFDKCVCYKGNFVYIQGNRTEFEEILFARRGMTYWLRLIRVLVG